MPEVFAVGGCYSWVSRRGAVDGRSNGGVDSAGSVTLDETERWRALEQATRAGGIFK